MKYILIVDVLIILHWPVNLTNQNHKPYPRLTQNWLCVQNILNVFGLILSRTRINFYCLTYYGENRYYNHVSFSDSKYQIIVYIEGRVNHDIHYTNKSNYCSSEER